ncbi:sodium/hydrogen exchanger 1 [Octopus sinensis]|uniref:Sodium/hydrogen exchanger n=1 Tax=Octopus sinensis TaxID=2607531 RepID=A0A7E6FHI0_9MOLL|nr:sodium/hydrogen exchanger 1 [Octopus sinensis]XP_036367038.1 sodium/hydrogen exchanger 1 [Octopus sinensis]
MYFTWHALICLIFLAKISTSVNITLTNATPNGNNKLLSTILDSSVSNTSPAKVNPNLQYFTTNKFISAMQTNPGNFTTKVFSASSQTNNKVPPQTQSSNNSVSQTTPFQQTSDPVTLLGNGSSNSEMTTSGQNLNKTVRSIIISHQIHLVQFNIHHTSVILYIACTTLAAVFLAVGFHHCHRLARYIPESCFLLCLGIAFGCVIRFTSLDELIPETFSPDIFFLVLLPPVILGASYSLNNRIFYDNLGVVLLFAVLGTAVACFIIAPLLYGLSLTPALNLPKDHLLTQIFLFSALIVAVDPVAVLAVFSELGVNKPLHIVVFGESLLNDGVSVVLYRVMDNFHQMPEITGKDIGFGFLKFLVSAGVSSLMGSLIGIFSTVACKFTYVKHVLEPAILIITAYLSYVLAESFELSGIICMIVCGLIQAQYAFHNINPKSRTNLKFIIKTIGLAAELVIFIFLGISVARTRHVWNAGFIIWSLVACIFSRTLITLVFSYFINKFHGERMKIFSLKEQLVMSYGGLRGGVAFSLALQLSEEHVTLRGMFLTTVLMIILFNVVIQGISIRPLINILKVKLEEKAKKNLLCTINHQLTDSMLQLVEKISGHSGKNVWRKKLEKFELTYIQRCLLKEPHPTVLKIGDVNTKIAIRNVYSSMSSLASQSQIEERYVRDRYTSLAPVQYELNVRSERPGKTSIGKELNANQLLRYVKSKTNSENSTNKEIRFYLGDHDFKKPENGHRNGIGYTGDSIEDISDNIESMSRL